MAGLKSTSEAKRGGRGSTAAPAGGATTGQDGGKKFSEKGLTAEEAEFLLGLIVGHREYYRLLGGSSRCSEQSRGRYEKIEVMALKLEVMAGARVGVSGSV